MGRRDDRNKNSPKRKMKKHDKINYEEFRNKERKI